MEPMAFIDFETQSAAELVTPHKYASHESTRVACVVVKVDNHVHRIGPYLDDEAKRFLAGVAATHTLVAHNAPFDAAIWKHHVGAPARWFDTLPRARAAGFPGGLDKIGNILEGRGKDPLGKRYIDMLCKVKAHGGEYKYPAGTPYVWEGLIEYCARDVELLEALYHRVKYYGEPKVIDVDRTINERGVPVDRGLLTRLQELYTVCSGEAAEEFDRMTKGVNPRSSVQMRAWLESVGFNVSSINRNAMKQLMADPDSFYEGEDCPAAFVEVAKAMSLRSEVVRVGRSKIDAAFKYLDPDDRMRELTVYYGAHTGRWTGRGPQLQNVPHAIPGLDFEEALSNLTVEYVRSVAARSHKRGGEQAVSLDVLNSLLRPIVRSKLGLLVADYSQVEARCVAWIAGEEKLLAIYRDTSRNQYCELGSTLYGRTITKRDEGEYIVSKALMLGCMYGMSGRKFASLCRLNDINVESLLNRGFKVEDAVRVFRETYPKVVEAWRDLGCALLSVVKGGREQYLCRCHITMIGSDLHIILPSGRPIVYRCARAEFVTPIYAAWIGKPDLKVETVLFIRPNGGVGYLYGSLAFENIAQAICRDLLAESLVNAEQDGLHPILHVHDEDVTEDEPDKLGRLMEIMTTGSPWATGFPVMAEGYAGPFWAKGGSFKVHKYLQGRPV